MYQQCVSMETSVYKHLCFILFKSRVFYSSKYFLMQWSRSAYVVIRSFHNNYDFVKKNKAGVWQCIVFISLHINYSV